jgi:hypothetical protein
VTASGNVTLNRLTLVSGENGGNAYGGAGGSGGTATFTAQAGLSAKTITTSGAVNLTVDSLISKKGFKLTATGAPNTLSISSYVFDLTGAENGSVLLDIDGITGLPAPSGSVSFGGLPGGLYVGDKITLIDEGLDGTAWSQTGVSVAGCTLTVTKQGTKLTAEVTAKSKFSGGSGGGGGCDAGFGLLGVVALLGLAAARGRR